MNSLNKNDTTITLRRIYIKNNIFDISDNIEEFKTFDSNFHRRAREMKKKEKLL